MFHAIRHTKKIPLFVYVCVFVLAIVIGLCISQLTWNPKPSDTSLAPDTSSCKTFGSQPLDASYYKIHTVKAGDSLATISNQYFGTGEKIAEIVNINKDIYPFLEENPFLEKGWQLKIPQHDLGPIQCELKKYAGMVVEPAHPDGQIWITKERSAGSSGPIQFASHVDIRNMEQFKPGDCVYVFNDKCTNSYPVKTVKIIKQ